MSERGCAWDALDDLLWGYEDGSGRWTNGRLAGWNPTPLALEAVEGNDCAAVRALYDPILDSVEHVLGSKVRRRLDSIYDLASDPELTDEQLGAAVRAIAPRTPTEPVGTRREPATDDPRPSPSQAGAAGTPFDEDDPAWRTDRVIEDTEGRVWHGGRGDSGVDVAREPDDQPYPRCPDCGLPVDGTLESVETTTYCLNGHAQPVGGPT